MPLVLKALGGLLMFIGVVGGAASVLRATNVADFVIAVALGALWISVGVALIRVADRKRAEARRRVVSERADLERGAEPSDDS